MLSVTIQDRVNQICKSTTGDMKTGDFVRTLIEANISEALDIMCGTYDSMTVCQIKTPDMVKELRTTIQSHNQTFDHTPFVSLLRFIDRMDSNVNAE